MPPTFDELTLTAAARCCAHGPPLRTLLTPLLQCAHADGAVALYCSRCESHLCEHAFSAYVTTTVAERAALPWRRPWPMIPEPVR